MDPYSFNFAQGSRRGMTPRQNSLSGVIICPAYRRGQRLKVNSITSRFEFMIAPVQSQQDSKRSAML